MTASEEEDRGSFDYLVIGAGPAGLQLGYFLAESGCNYAILEARERAGSFFARYPRHRTLLSINKVYTGRDDPEFNLRHDWNSLLCDRSDFGLSSYTKEYFPPADALVEYLGQFAREFDLQIHYGVTVAQISKTTAEHAFEVRDRAGGRWRGKRLIVATGLYRPFIPDIPGIELAVGYEDMSLDRSDYRNKSVLILGKGNSALETADHLIADAAVIHVLSPSPVTLAWDTRHVGHVRAVNNNFFDTYHLKSQNAAIDGNVHRISRDDDGRLVVEFASIHVENETERIRYDHVLRCTGFRFDDSMFDESCRPQLRACGRLPAMTPGFESLNVPNLYFAGATMQSLDYKKGQSAFIHGFRYNVRSLFHMLRHRDEGVDLPGADLDAEPAPLARAILDRMSRVSSLWQQVGFLCDVLIDAGGGVVRCIHDLPYDYARAAAPHWRPDGRFYLVLFRFGECNTSLFDHPRSADVFEGATSTASHPVIERWEGAAKVDEFHVLEDFAADWTGEEYVDSLRRYFEAVRRGEALAKEQGPGVREIVRESDMRLAR
ncbi:MAG: NAD(P)-binding domain-containing protein [Myxococcales bacterium]|nr:NAD(P)-binding domain-containing protein [Myxococcales bacterium]